MVKLIGFLTFLLLVNTVVAQKSLSLQGKWKFVSITQVISSSRDSLYYDLDKDSMHIPSEDLKEAYKDGHDSVSTVKLFKNMYQSFTGSSFTFSGDSVIFKYKSTIAQGIFETKNDTLELLLKYDNGEPTNLSYTYSVKEAILWLVMKIDIGYYKYILRRE